MSYNLYLDNLPEVVDTSSPDKGTTSTSEISSDDISDGEENISDLSTINSQGKRVITKAAWDPYVYPYPACSNPYV